MMKTKKMIIEKSSDSFDVYTKNINGMYGTGEVVEKCEQFILDSIETIKTLDDLGMPLELKGDYEVVF